jgi:hypothetical protein
MRTPRTLRSLVRGLLALVQFCFCLSQQLKHFNFFLQIFIDVKFEIRRNPQRQLLGQFRPHHAGRVLQGIQRRGLLPFAAHDRHVDIRDRQIVADIHARDRRHARQARIIQFAHDDLRQFALDRACDSFGSTAQNLLTSNEQRVRRLGLPLLVTCYSLLLHKSSIL